MSRGPSPEPSGELTRPVGPNRRAPTSRHLEMPQRCAGTPGTGGQYPRPRINSWRYFRSVSHMARPARVGLRAGRPSGMLSVYLGTFMRESGEVTRLLGEIGRGDKDAMNQLMPLVYDELHRLARGYFRRERGEHTLQPTALVHEAYLRLVDQRTSVGNRGHFLALAATQMRRILLDYARKHRSARRGGPDGRQVLLEDTMAISTDT